MEGHDWPQHLGDAIAAVSTSANPYEASLDIRGCAVDCLVTSTVASRLYLVWAALTDRFELKPAERADALAEMTLASTEWLAAKDQPLARDAYLDRWQYDILGYDRPNQ